MSHPFYADYKDSGAEWLGEVPSHWTVTRIGGLFREVVEEGEEGLPILSVSIHNGVSDKELDEKEAERKVTRSEDATTYKTVRPGDLVYNMMRAWQGAFGAVQVAGMVSPAYVVARPTEEFLTRYVELVLRTPNAVEEMRRHSQGVTDFRLRLYWDEFKTIRVALPPLAEQAAILSFLDQETARIDSLVAEQETLIALVKEKRLAVICRAVTKGLNPTVPMKDSGIDWLGEVPEHWAVVRLKRVVLFQRGHDLPLEDREDGETPVVSSGGFLGTHSKAQAEGPGIVTGRYGTIGQFVFVETDYWPLNTALYTVEFFGNSEKFVWYMLHSIAEHFTMHSQKSAVPGVDRNDIHEVIVTVPCLAEQYAIASYLEAETVKLDALVAEAERAIDLLREHRAALISAAVTGKIDVRGLVDMEAA